MNDRTEKNGVEKNGAAKHAAKNHAGEWGRRLRGGLRAGLLALLLAVPLAACERPAPEDEVEAEPTIEETVILQAFAHFVSVQAYDEVCLEGSLRSMSPENPRLVVYLGNTEMLAARAGGVWRDRHPEGTVDDGVGSLMRFQQGIIARMTDRLRAEGCESEAGEDVAKAWELYTTIHPAILYGMLNREIEQRGGTVTAPESAREAEGAEGAEDAAGADGAAAAEGGASDGTSGAP